MIMRAIRGVLVVGVSAVALALPSLASASTSHCGNLSGSDLYSIVGHNASCSVAKAVAKAEVHALLSQGSGAKHFINVKGRRWHYTWRNVDVQGGQIEYYTARSGSKKVTFQTRGSN
jgi:hypothetical protein